MICVNANLHKRRKGQFIQWHELIRQIIHSFINPGTMLLNHVWFAAAPGRKVTRGEKTTNDSGKWMIENYEPDLVSL